MSVEDKPRSWFDMTFVGGGVLMVLCCAVGPAVIGAPRRMATTR
jgi:hypothetical protein